MPDDLPLPVTADEAGEELARLVALTDNPYVPGSDKKYTEFTAKRKAAFITAVAAGASATKAADLAGVVKSTAYYQRRVDPQFAEAWEYAKEQQVDGLEDALRGLAVDSKNIAAIIWSLKKALYLMVRRRGEQVGIDGLHPHSFRHSCATRLLASGLAEAHIRTLLGWSRGSRMLERCGASAASERALEARRAVRLVR